MVVVDHDRTRKAGILSGKLDATIYFDVVANLPDTAALIALSRPQPGPGGYRAAPPDWSADLKADRQSPLQVIIDGSDPNYAGNTRAFITAF